MARKIARGFTLIEVMVTVAIVAILASVALPSYSAYVMRSRVPVALDGLSAYHTRMEQRYQDVGNYGPAAGACWAALPTVANFTVTCAVGATNQTYTATATGTGSMTGYAYTINHLGARSTVHPKGDVANCWSIKGATCDA